ncbi:MAG: hypothetical protein DRP08_03020 [Candidatus Aenigmatarchaeota archaeon]|nr:MAG: hypothetical protein DRP08_03020 [Candidatus Aenigmarchaeota archaeon]
MKREHLILIAIIVLGAFLRFYRLDGEYVHALDSYRILSDAVRVLSFEAPKYVSAWPGRSIAIAPFLLIKNNELIAQIGIAVYGTALISLSYFLISRYFKVSSTVALLFSGLVAVNPKLVIMSKVVIWDIIILFFIVAAIIAAKSLAEKKSLLFSVFFALLAFFICYMKPTNLIFALIAFFYLSIKRGLNSIEFDKIKLYMKHNTDLLASLFIFLFLYGLNILVHPSLASSIASGGGFFENAYYSGNLKATIRLLAVPLNSPTTNMDFIGIEQMTPLLAFLGMFQVTAIILGIKRGVIIARNETILLLGIAFAYAALFLGYPSWVGRQLLPSLLIMILFLVLGINEIYSFFLKKRKLIERCFLLYLAIVLIISASYSTYTSFSQVSIWGSNESKTRNFIVVDPNDMRWLETSCEEVDLIVTGYGAWCEYVLGKDKSEEIVINFFDFDREYENSPENQYILVEIVKGYLQEGKTVWFLSGWIDGYNYANMKRYASALEENFRLVKIYQGNKKFVDKQGVVRNSFIIYNIETIEDQK